MCRIVWPGLEKREGVSVTTPTRTLIIAQSEHNVKRSTTLTLTFQWQLETVSYHEKGIQSQRETRLTTPIPAGLSVGKGKLSQYSMYGLTKVQAKLHNGFEPLVCRVM
jgi:hypothetical protein